jgi:hypothetical protein
VKATEEQVRSRVLTCNARASATMRYFAGIYPSGMPAPVTEQSDYRPDESTFFFRHVKTIDNIVKNLSRWYEAQGPNIHNHLDRMVEQGVISEEMRTIMQHTMAWANWECELLENPHPFAKEMIA